MNIYCCCLQKYVNKLMKIQNEPKSHLPTSIIGKKSTLISNFALYISNMNIYCCMLLFTKMGYQINDYSKSTYSINQSIIVNRHNETTNKLVNWFIKIFGVHSRFSCRN